MTNFGQNANNPVISDLAQSYNADEDLQVDKVHPEKTYIHVWCSNLNCCNNLQAILFIFNVLGLPDDFVTVQ